MKTGTIVIFSIAILMVGALATIAVMKLRKMENEAKDDTKDTKDVVVEKIIDEVIASRLA